MQSVTHFYKFGIRQFVVIRGDGVIHEKGFKYASELVEVIRKNFLDVAIYVAGYPENEAELEFTNKKIELGVNACITQVCFDSATISKFRDNLKLPVLPGLVLPTEKSLEFSKKLGLALPNGNIDDQSSFLRKQIEDELNARRARLAAMFEEEVKLISMQSTFRCFNIPARRKEGTQPSCKRWKKLPICVEIVSSHAPGTCFPA